MDWPDYLRDQANMIEQTDDPIVKDELLELASICEEVANNIDDHLRVSLPNVLGPCLCWRSRWQIRGSKRIFRGC
jgi:hypothetical protein